MSSNQDLTITPGIGEEDQIDFHNPNKPCYIWDESNEERTISC